VILGFYQGNMESIMVFRRDKNELEIKIVKINRFNIVDLRKNTKSYVHISNVWHII